MFDISAYIEKLRLIIDKPNIIRKAFCRTLEKNGICIDEKSVNINGNCISINAKPSIRFKLALIQNKINQEMISQGFNVLIK